MVVDWSPNGLGELILSLTRRQEITGNQLRPLVNQLIESMLAVRAGLPPNDRASLDRDFVSIYVNGFAVRLHITLLKICCESVHVLVVW
jgi:hypothetical protein